MGRQSSRLIYQEKDHKDIFFQGKYHKAMYLGSKLLWKKLQKIIPYISYDHYYREMCINTLDVDSKTIKKVARLIGTEFNDDKLARGDNTVGYMVGDTSWAFSRDGQNFVQTERAGTSYREISAYAGYALTKNYIISSVRESTVADIYAVVSRDIDSFKFSSSSSLGKLYGRIYSGFVKPELDILIQRGYAEGSDHPYWRYRIEDAKTLRTLYSFGYTFIDNYKNLLGSDDRYIYTFFYNYYSSNTDRRNVIERYDYVTGNHDSLFSTIERNFYMNIIGSLYENGKFIVYCINRRISQTSVEGRLKIYETIDFLSFAEVETPQSITVKDISSDGEYIISFDSDVNGDAYIHPYCNLDNTYYFDEDGVMHDDKGCLFHANMREAGFKKIVTIYFDNHYFRESDNNFCQILLFEEEDIEPPLG